MDEKILVTGIGIVNPLGTGVQAFTEGLRSQIPAIHPITVVDPTGMKIKIGGEVSHFQPSQYFDKRLLVKTARFTNFALVSMKLALEDAALDLSQHDKSRMGIWFGNNAGGWDLCHQGFYELYTQGSQMVNPWQATGWFPTAAQGFVSIRFGITGLSKSFVADRVSGASALYFAIQAMRAGLIDTAFVGGCEAPFTRFGLLCYHETGQMSAEDYSRAPYRPFDPNSPGIVLGEGGVVLVLEKESAALKRNAPIYGEIASGAMATDLRVDENKMLKKTMEEALSKSNISPHNLDLILAEGCGEKTCDKLELDAIHSFFDKQKIQCPVVSPKSLYGHLYGASLVTELAAGLVGMKHRFLPLISREEEKSMRSFLLNARSREGVNASFIVNNYHQER